MTDDMISRAEVDGLLTKALNELADIEGREEDVAALLALMHTRMAVCRIRNSIRALPAAQVQAEPSSDYSWEWSRWRLARFGELVSINALLMKTWRE